MARSTLEEGLVRIPAGEATLEGNLILPPGATGLVLFAHGSGSSRKSPRNRFVAEALRASGLGTLLFDLLTPREEGEDEYSRKFRFDIPLLARRLAAATAWVRAAPAYQNLKLGYFGASTGSAAALIAAAEQPAGVAAVVSRGGRPDLAADHLGRVKAPTLLIVGGWDGEVIDLNREAFDRLTCPKELKIVPGATHLFEEPGTLEEVARLATAWFAKYLAAAA